MKVDIVNTVLLSGAFLLLFTIAEICYHFFNVKVEWTRKLVHAGTGLLSLLFPLFLESHWSVLLLCSSFALMLLLSLKFNLLQSINAIERKSFGSLAFPVSVYGCYLAFDFLSATAIHPEKQLIYFYLPILILAICDPVAALMGKRYPYGKIKIAGGTKTLMGSGMFFLSALLISVLALNYQNADMLKTTLLYQGGLIALATMLAEGLSGKGFDNVTIPAATLLCLSFLEEIPEGANIIIASL